MSMLEYILMIVVSYLIIGGTFLFWTWMDGQWEEVFQTYNSRVDEDSKVNRRFSYLVSGLYCLVCWPCIVLNKEE